MLNQNSVLALIVDFWNFTGRMKRYLMFLWWWGRISGRGVAGVLYLTTKKATTYDSQIFHTHCSIQWSLIPHSLYRFAVILFSKTTKCPHHITESPDPSTVGVQAFRRVQSLRICWRMTNLTTSLVSTSPCNNACSFWTSELLHIHLSLWWGVYVLPIMLLFL